MDDRRDRGRGAQEAVGRRRRPRRHRLLGAHALGVRPASVPTRRGRRRRSGSSRRCLEATKAGRRSWARRRRRAGRGRGGSVSAGQFAAVEPNVTGRENLRLIGLLTQMETSAIPPRAGGAAGAIRYGLVADDVVLHLRERLRDAGRPMPRTARPAPAAEKSRGLFAARRRRPDAADCASGASWIWS